ARAKQEQMEARGEDLKLERDRYMEKVTPLKHEREELEKELLSLQQRSSQIPDDDIRLRRRLITELKLTEEDLPFVGELLRVRSSEERWEPAIERLLHNFGRRLLVVEHL